MKINLRSIIITVVIILLASNICIGIFYANKYEKFKKIQQDTIIYQINIKRYEIKKDIENNDRELAKNTYIYEKIRDSIINASNNNNFLFFSDYTQKYDSIRFNKSNYNR